MQNGEKKLTARQLVFLVFCTMFSPAVRLFSVLPEERVAFCAPLIAGGVLIVFLWTVVRKLMQSGQGFANTMRFAFGKKLSLVVTVLYLVWGTWLFALQNRYCALRLSTAAYERIPAIVFSVLTAALCAVALSSGTATVARIGELVLPALFFVTVLLLTLLSGSAERLLPAAGALPTLHASLFVLASFGYLTFATFFSDETHGRIITRTTGMTVVASLTAAWLFACVTAGLGRYLVRDLPLPFFSAVQQITVGEFVQHIDAFVVTLWIVSDFILLCVIASSVLKLLEGLNARARRQKTAVPFAAISLLLLPLAGKDERAAAALSAHVFMPANLVFLFLIPALVCLTASIREKKKDRTAVIAGREGSSTRR